MIRIVENDYRDLLKYIKDDSVELLLTDPPYNASNSKLSASDGSMRTINEVWDKDFDPIDFMNRIVPKIKPSGTLLVWCSYHLLGKYLSYANDQLSFREIIHWYKPSGVPSLTGRLYGFAIEYCLWWTKGANYTFNSEHRASYLNVFQMNTLKVTDHPAEKPLPIIKALVKTHSNKDDLVMDCFLGSGTTAVACRDHERNFIGCDFDPKWIGVAKSRVELSNTQFDLL